MNDWFAITPEGEAHKFVEFVTATKGHKDLVKQAYVKVARRYDINNATLLLQRLRELVPILAEQGFLEGMVSEDGTRFKAYKRWVPVEKLTIHQFLAAFASFQIAVGKIFDDMCLQDLSLMTKVVDRRLHFKANDPQVVLDVLCRLLSFVASPIGTCPRDYEELCLRFHQFVIYKSELLQARPLVRAAA